MAHAEEASGNAPGLADIWAATTEALVRAELDFAKEMEACWAEARRVLSSVAEVPAPPAVPAPGLDAYAGARAALSESCFQGAAARWQTLRPVRRSLAALEAYGRELEREAAAVPEYVSASGRDINRAFPGSVWGDAGRLFRPLRLARRPRPLRAALRTALGWRGRETAASGNVLLGLIAEAGRLSRRPWEILSEELDLAAEGSPRDAGASEAVRRVFARKVSDLDRRAAMALASLHRRVGGAARSAAAPVPRLLLGRAASKGRTGEGPLTDFSAGWAEVRRLSDGEFGVEQGLVRVAEGLLKDIGEALDAISREEAELSEEIKDCLAWLDARMGGSSADGFPPPRTDVAAAAARLSELETAAGRSLAALPGSQESTSSFLPRAFGRRKIHVVEPARVLREALARFAWGAAGASFAEAEAAHRRWVETVEQAREVVAFAQDEAQRESTGESAADLVTDSLRSSRGLLAHALSEPTDWRSGGEARLVSALAASLREVRVMLGRRRLGVWSYLTSQGARRVFHLFAALAVERLSGWKRTGLETGARQGRRLLAKIGWTKEDGEGKVQVVRRPLLPAEFVSGPRIEDLPALYGRLFRPEPVKNPRFLVGREEELAALVEARRLFEAGRRVSFLVVGERGSGKTSLLECAVQDALAGFEMVRGEFGRRITSAAEMRAFVAGMLGGIPPETIEPHLAGARRLVILEELERSFLRCPGGFEAVREFQRIVASTSATTFWLVSINRSAFRLLDAALALGGTFSHRANAANETRDELRAAILLRHRLSGLRLRFLPPREEAVGVLARLDRWMRGKRAPEDVFFDRLARESDGLFRAAFTIWLHHVESAEGGVLTLKSLEPPDLSGLMADLRPEALFSLAAVLQHGSLTTQEHCAVFLCGEDESKSRLEDLLARELVQADPGREGLRVRPESLRVVWEALYRSNLV